MNSFEIPRGISYETAFAAAEAAGNNSFATPIANDQFDTVRELAEDMSWGQYAAMNWLDLF
jgi:hypothetical protein